MKKIFIFIFALVSVTAQAQKLEIVQIEGQQYLVQRDTVYADEKGTPRSIKTDYQSVATAADEINQQIKASADRIAWIDGKIEGFQADRKSEQRNIKQLYDALAQLENLPPIKEGIAPDAVPASRSAAAAPTTTTKKKPATKKKTTTSTKAKQ